MAPFLVFHFPKCWQQFSSLSFHFVFLFFPLLLFVVLETTQGSKHTRQRLTSELHTPPTQQRFLSSLFGKIQQQNFKCWEPFSVDFCIIYHQLFQIPFISCLDLGRLYVSSYLSMPYRLFNVVAYIALQQLVQIPMPVVMSHVFTCRCDCELPLPRFLLFVLHSPSLLPISLSLPLFAPSFCLLISLIFIISFIIVILCLVKSYELLHTCY